MLKKAGFSILYLIALALLVEGTGHLAFRLSQGSWFDLSDMKADRKAILDRYDKRDQRLAAEYAAEKAQTGRWKVEIVHPYIGYVLDHDDPSCGSLGFCDDRMRRYREMFPDKHFVPDTDENLVIAVTGGSFANGVANGSSPEKWETALSEIPAFADKNIFIYSFAAGGVKQPQQLGAISFFLGIGASFDAIINIDGFNEIALPAAENVPRGVSPYFPRFWHRRVARSKLDPAISRLEGEHAFLEQAQKDLILRFENSVFRNTALGNLVWIILNDRAQLRVAEAEQRAQSYQPDPRKLVARLESLGPDYQHTDYMDTMEKLVTFWARSSRSLQGIAAAHDTPYFHFLQPNQYLEGSKPMSEEEKAIAVIEKYPYSEAAIAGYPLLIEEGKRLRESGVNFFDLTNIYLDKEEVLYRDACCHVNQQGYDYVVEAIVSTIESQISRFDQTAR